MEHATTSDRIRESYETTPYPGGAYWGTHPTCIATVATIMGLTPQSPDDCRVLEIGCATGGNLIPMATQLPTSEFLGIDLSPSQVEVAQEVVDVLEIHNLDFRAMDVRDVDESFGQFHYVICHGVFSWVPREVQDAILAVCQQRLEPNGIAYISYNTHPGAHTRALAHGVARFGASQVLEEPRNVSQIRALWQAVRNAMPREDHVVALQLDKALQDVEGKPEYYVAHEYLEDVNEPLWFHDFADRIKRVGLQYLGEAARTAELDDLPTKTQDAIKALAPSLIAREQLLDLAANVAFRRSLVCSETLEFARSASPDVLMSLYAYGSSTRLEGEGAGPSYRTLGGRVFSTNAPVLVAALDLLHDAWPGGVNVAELFRQASACRQPADISGAQSEEFFYNAIVRLWLKNAVTLMVQPVSLSADVPPRPAVAPLTRLKAARRAPVTNLLHQTVELPDQAYRILPLLDGTRDLEALQAALTAEGDESGQTVPQDLALEDYLQRFAKMGLLQSANGSGS